MTTASGGWTARLRLDPSAFVAPGAVVVGDVTLGPRSSVWFNAVVRGDSAPVEIGEESNLQDLCVVHEDEGLPARVGARVTIGHRAIVHGCVIEDDCLIGMGAILLSGARIGRGSLVGAGALVREGQIVLPGSRVIGLPGRVVGEVAPEQRERFRESAAHYAALARSYLERGFARPHPAPGRDAGITARDERGLDHLEWAERLGVLAAGPSWVAERLERWPSGRWTRTPGPGRWCALEVLCHLRDSDRDVLLPRLERMLTERHPMIPDVSMRGWEAERAYRDERPEDVLAAWRETRRTVVARLAPLGPDAWDRVGWHSARGPYPLGDMVRAWVEHDLSHRRQLALALGDDS